MLHQHLSTVIYLHGLNLTNQIRKLNKNLGMRTDSGPLPFRNKFLCYNRKKGGAKVKEFLENIVKVFITLAILGPVIALVGIGLGIGALLF